MPTDLSPAEAARSHRRHAVECNNLAWAFNEAPNRTPEQDAEMLDAAHASAFHWAKVGTALNNARAQMLLAHVLASLGHGQIAMAYARQSNEYLLSHDPPDWVAAFAHAFLAHAAFAARDAELHHSEYAEARELGKGISDPEDSRIFFKSFNVIPRPRDLGA